MLRFDLETYQAEGDTAGVDLHINITPGPTKIPPLHDMLVLCILSNPQVMQRIRDCLTDIQDIANTPHLGDFH